MFQVCCPLRHISSLAANLKDNMNLCLYVIIVCITRWCVSLSMLHAWGKSCLLNMTVLWDKMCASMCACVHIFICANEATRFSTTWPEICKRPTSGFIYQSDPELCSSPQLDFHYPSNVPQGIDN